MLANNIVQPSEVTLILDNKGYSIDRYTVCILFEDGESYVIATSPRPTHPLGVWSIDENGFIDVDELEESGNEHLGTEIEWDELPEEVRNTIVNYFEL